MVRWLGILIFVWSLFFPASFSAHLPFFCSPLTGHPFFFRNLVLLQNISSQGTPTEVLWGSRPFFWLGAFFAGPHRKYLSQTWKKYLESDFYARARLATPFISSTPDPNALKFKACIHSTIAYPYICVLCQTSVFYLSLSVLRVLFLGTRLPERVYIGRLARIFTHEPDSQNSWNAGRVHNTLSSIHVCTGLGKQTRPICCPDRFLVSESSERMFPLYLCAG